MIVLGSEVNSGYKTFRRVKLLKIDHWKAPTTLMMLQSVGLKLDYCRDAFQKYSTIMAPIGQLVSQGNIKWLHDLPNVRGILVLLQFPHSK